MKKLGVLFSFLQLLRSVLESFFEMNTSSFNCLPHCLTTVRFIIYIRKVAKRKQFSCKETFFSNNTESRLAYGNVLLFKDAMLNWLCGSSFVFLTLSWRYRYSFATCIQVILLSFNPKFRCSLLNQLNTSGKHYNVRKSVANTRRIKRRTDMLSGWRTMWTSQVRLKLH